MSQFQSSGYEVERTTGTCAITGKTLEPHEVYMATLVEEGDDLKRIDIAMDAWDEGKRPEHLFSYWRAVVPEPTEKKKLFVDDEVLMNLLRRLEDATQPQRVGFRFVLALILMRKKLLRYDRTERRLVNNPAGEDVEQQWWCMTPKLDLAKGPMGKWHDDETIEVLDPQLDEQQTRNVTEQLGEILHAEL